MHARAAPGSTPSGPRTAAARGFTLVECAVVCAIAAVLASVALPSWRQHALRAARVDAVDALTRVQLAQEQFRALHGRYSEDIGALRGAAPFSAQGLYAVALTLDGADGYRAIASARGAQKADSACPALTLRVAQGFASAGPDPGCWNR